ncbi:MAG: hypothetical protein IPI67_18610 [Myxococcales bacterium]|nr:hypothetical protein [Myxococcales bacterium]
MQRLLLGPFVLSALVSCENGTAAPDATRAPQARVQALESSAGATPRIALFATAPGASETALFFTPPGASSIGTPVARFEHAPDAEVRGAVLGNGSRVVAVADMERRTDVSFGAWLVRLEPEKSAVVLAKDVSHASRPLVLPSGRVLVQRGVPGPPPDPAAIEAGQLRTDALRIDEIDPETGNARTLHELAGYITFIAGLLDDEVLLYRVRFGHADLVAVSVTTGALRVIAPELVALARDFSVETSTRSLVYTNHDDDGWLVERIAIDSGVRSPVARAAGMWVTPHVWPRGGVLLNDGSGATVAGGPGPTRPLGPGFDELRAVSSDGRHVALIHQKPSDFSLPFAIDTESGKLTAIPAPPATRVDIAGFLP